MYLGGYEERRGGIARCDHRMGETQLVAHDDPLRMQFDRGAVTRQFPRRFAADAQNIIVAPQVVREEEGGIRFPIHQKGIVRGMEGGVQEGEKMEDRGVCRGAQAEYCRGAQAEYCRGRIVYRFIRCCEQFWIQGSHLLRYIDSDEVYSL